MRIEVLLPENCDPRSPPPARFDGTAFTAEWRATCPGGLAGGVIAIPGLERTQTDVLVRYAQTVAGPSEARRLTPGESRFEVPVAPSRLGVAVAYLGLGFEHILEGADHLLFVFALLLLIRDRWRLLGAITAFTVAHSLTLAAAVLGWLIVPAPPVEAVIALSIMFLAAELLRRTAGRDSLFERIPWTVAFVFGLLHGLGFGRALLELGLPERDVPLALLTFNIGVELGQLAFVAVVLAAAALLRRIQPQGILALWQPGAPGTLGLGYAVGGIAAFWFVERVVGF